MEENLGQIQLEIRQAAESIGLNLGLSKEDREDLASSIYLKLAANDFEILRQFRGEAKLSTYLKVLAQNEATDEIRRRRGKFRPAAKTRQRGEWACRYEYLRRCEGRNPVEAKATLESEGFVLSMHEIESLEEEVAARLPLRSFESTDRLRLVSDGESNPEQLALAEEERAERKRLMDELSCALNELPDADRAFLRLYCEPQAKARAKRLARMFGMEAPEVYRRFQKLCRALKRSLRDRGLGADEVSLLLADWQDDWENFPTDPSPITQGKTHRHE